MNFFWPTARPGCASRTCPRARQTLPRVAWSEKQRFPSFVFRFFYLPINQALRSRPFCCGLWPVACSLLAGSRALDDECSIHSRDRSSGREQRRGAGCLWSVTCRERFAGVCASAPEGFSCARSPCCAQRIKRVEQDERCAGNRRRNGRQDEALRKEQVGYKGR